MTGLRTHERGAAAEGAGERGVALLYALIFTTVVSLVVAALLTQSSVQFKAADAYSDRRDSVFAADAGLEQALSTIGLMAAPAGSGSSGTCVDPLVCPTTPVLENRKEAAGTAPLSVTNVALAKGVGNNRLVVVATGSGVVSSVGSVTYNGVAMRRATARASQACFLWICWEANTEVWYMLDAQLPASPGSYTVQVTHSTGSSVGYSAHVSSWVGVLQDIGGVPYVPVNGGAKVESNAGSISSSLTLGADNTVLFSSVAHGDDDIFRGCENNDTFTGSGAGTRLAYGPNPSSCTGFATSYELRNAGSQTATETFTRSSTSNAQVVVGLRAAASAPSAAPVFGAICIAEPIHLADVNGFTVDVECTMTDVDVLTLTSTATNGEMTLVGRAVLERRPDGRVDIASWNTRPETPDP